MDEKYITNTTPPVLLSYLARWSRNTTYFKGKWRLVDAVFKYWLKHCSYSEVVQLEENVSIKCDLWDEGPHAIWWCGKNYEIHETHFLLECLKPDMTFLDIGANIGYYTLLGAVRVKSVHAFEPVSRQFQTLKDNVNRNSYLNVKLNQMIVSDQSGSMSIKLGPPEHSGIASVSNQNISTQRSETVQAITLDKYVNENALKSVHIVKVDVEGHEMCVLAGATKLLEAYRPILLLEVKRPHLASSGSSPEQIFDFMRKFNYSAWRILPHSNCINIDRAEEGKLIAFKPN